MATIEICAMAPHGPAGLHATVRKHPVFGEHGPDVDALFLYLGDDTVRVWPADPERIRELAEELEKLVSDLASRTPARSMTAPRPQEDER